MATRYWVGGGSSANWNATGNTNWGTASGVQDNASVPTSVDDVIFDGAGAGGNTNSIISAEITILSFTITTGYTATMTHNARVNISGNWTYTGNYTIAGTSSVTVIGNSTITSNGVTWPNDLGLAGVGVTKTLSGNLTVNGLLTINDTTTINRTTTEVLTLAGGMYLIGSISGTADITWTGGTWSQFSGIYSISNNTTIAGNVTVSGLNPKISGGTWTYSSGTVTTTGSRITVSASCTLNTNGIAWNDFYVTGSTIITLTSNLLVNGFFNSTATLTVTRTTAETLTIAGGISHTGAINSTADIYLTGGTWTSSNATVVSNLFINGNVTFGTETWFRGTFTYLGGSVTTTGNTFRSDGSSTFNANGIVFNNFNVRGVSSVITLTSNFSMSGTLSSVNAFSINKTTTETFTTSGGLNMATTISGTSKIILTGGTWTNNQWVQIDLDINGNVTVSGTVVKYGGVLTYLSGTVTTTSSTLTVYGTTTLNTNGITWNNVTMSTISPVVTLTSNLSVGGLLTISATTTINRTTVETITCAGGMTINAALSGTADINWTGGTWSGGAFNISNNLNINGNVTTSGNVYYITNTMTYVSGIVTTTGSTLIISGSCTLNTNGVAWNNLTTNAILTVTLTSNLLINGLLRSNNTTTFTPTVSETVTCAGGILLTSIIGGAAEIIWTGGTWSAQNSNCIMNSNLTINGNVTLSGNVYYGSRTLLYTSGNVSVANSTLFLTSGAKVNTPNVSWNNVTGTGFSITITLLSDLIVNGLFTPGDIDGYGITYTKTTSERIICNGGMAVNGGSIVGNVDTYLRGGTWSQSVPLRVYEPPIYIDGNITISGLVRKSVGGITYLSGNVKSVNASLDITSSLSLTNINKVIFKSVLITAGQTITTNQPFIGTEEQICQVSSTGANYTITFTDTFEKIARNVAFSGATFTRPMQVVLATNPKFNTNRSTNVGLRYGNQVPNGVPKNNFPIWDKTLTGIQGGLQADPCFVRQG